MYNQPFFIPRYYKIPNIMIPATSTERNITFLNKLENIFHNIKSFNWTRLINNTSKTLGIINQSIPLVKQAGPMINNMKSMIKLASAFKDETDKELKTNTNNKQTKYKEHNNSNIQTESPTFFIN